MRILLKIITAPLKLVLNIIIWICKQILKCSAGLLGLISFLFAILTASQFMIGNYQSGWMMLVLTILISPFGLPMLSVILLSVFQKIGSLLEF